MRGGRGRGRRDLLTWYRGVGPRGVMQVDKAREGVRKEGQWRDITGPNAEAW